MQLFHQSHFKTLLYCMEDLCKGRTDMALKIRFFKAIKITFVKRALFLYLNSRCFSFKKQTILFSQLATLVKSFCAEVRGIVLLNLIR